MRYVELGRTGVQVSAVAMGCMSLRQDTVASGKAAVARAYELGINFYDNADVYARGDSETILGQALREGGIPRDKVVIATKCAIVSPGMNPEYAYKAYDLSPAYVKGSCEASLQRLGTDYVDLYQAHRIDYLTHPEETARAMEDLVSEGKVRYVGVSNYTEAEIRALSAYVRLEALQAQFSLLHIEPLETGLVSVCLEKKMSLLCWSPQHRGVLTAQRETPHDDWRQQREAGVVAQVSAMAKAYNVTTAQLSLAWLMQMPGGVIPLVGTANPEHIAEAAAAVEITLDRDDWYELLVIARGRAIPAAQSPFLYTGLPPSRK